MKIISVTGACSGVGKTMLCSIILGHLKSFGAIKFTKTSLYTQLIDDAPTILQDNKDTAILSRSGAENVVWIKSPVSNLEDALDIALGRMNNLAGVIIEGNSPVLFLDPHLIIFVIGEDGYMKPTAREVAEKADIFVVNTRADTMKRHTPFASEKENTPLFRINMKERTGEIDNFISYIKQYIEALR